MAYYYCPYIVQCCWHTFRTIDARSSLCLEISDLITDIILYDNNLLK